MNPIEPDDRLDALLREAMSDEAETVMPAGDGLARIQQRVAARRARLRWMRPAMIAGSAAAVALAGFGAYAVVHGDANGDSSVGVAVSPTPGTSSSPAPTPSTTTSVPVSAAGFPRLALYPFTTKALAKQWQRGYAHGGTMPWVADAKQVALNWMTSVVQQPSVNRLVGTTFASTGRTAAVTLGRTLTAESHRTVPVTTVHEVKYGDAWIVVGATDAGNLLKLTAPLHGATVTSPITVGGPGFGVDESLRAEVRGTDTSVLYGTGSTSAGNGGPWSTPVTFSTPTQPIGMVVVIDASNADGGPARIAVEKVRFATSSSSGAMPTYFYGIRNGRVTKFHSSDGSSVAYLTTPQPGGGADDPQLSSSGEQVYFLLSSGTCTNSISVVPTAASSPQDPTTVASADSGYVITGYDVGPVPSGASGAAKPALGYYEQACDSSRAPQAKLVVVNTAGQRHVIKFPSMPPAVVGDPSFEPGSPAAWDVTHLDAVVNTGHAATLTRYDAMRDTSPTPSRTSCPGFDSSNAEPGAMQVDSQSVVWFATQTGSSMQVEHCTANGNTAMVDFTVPGNRTPADLSVDNGAVLVTDTDGNIWTWSGAGDAVQLHPNAAVGTQITW